MNEEDEAFTALEREINRRKTMRNLNSTEAGDDFSEWYEEEFGSLLGAQDAENKNNIRKIWNKVLTHAAGKFEWDDFETYTGGQIADQLRRMKA